VALERSNEGLLFVMPFVPGVTAAALGRAAAKAGKPIPVPVVLRIVCDALSGLAAAHEATGPDGAPLGVIHRDVSPQNFLVGADGTTRLLDFGVAKARGRLQKTTRDGALKGKLAYMSPEQLHGTEVDATTDLYAAAVVAWELVAGDSLFLGDTDADTFRRVLTAEVPSLTSLRPDVPRALDAAFRRSLSEVRGARFPSARVMREELSAIVPPATHAEVAILVRELCAPLLDAQAAAVRFAEMAPEPPTVVDRPPPSVPVLVAPAPEPMRVAPARRRRVELVVAAFFAVVAAALFGALLRVRSVGAPPSAVAEPAPPSADTASDRAPGPPASAVPSSSVASPETTASAKGTASSPPRHTAPSHSASPLRRSAPNCDPPYTFDPHGRKIFRPECF
jgi:serine/threonine protein kinase